MSIDDLTRDCFAALIQVRRIDPAAPVDAQLLHRRLCGFIDQVVAGARESGLSKEDTGDVVYALVALADELVLAVAVAPQLQALQQFWMNNLLQLRYFNENLAGENFFNRLAALRGDARRAELLNVYYLCLLFGFQGRYRVRGGDAELALLVDTLRQELERAQILREEKLSPRGGRPAIAGSAARRNLPIVWLAAAAVGSALFINVALHISLAHGVSEVVARIGVLAAHATAH